MKNRVIYIIAIVSLAIALCTSWIIPVKEQLPLVKEVLPEAQSFNKIASSPLTFEGKIQTQGGQEETIGYVVIDQAHAYGGLIKIVTGIDPQGKIVGAVIANHKDTPSFIQILNDHKYLKQFIGKSIADPLSIEQDIDRVSGATYSSRGIAKAISQGSHAVARNQFGLDVQGEIVPFQFGLKEISVLSLVVLMLIGVVVKSKKLRWVTLIGSLVFIGFQFNTPISLANVAALLMGNFPSMRENLVWYVLLIGIPIITFILGRNVYCFWLCPFSAFQEIMAKIGGGNFKCCNKVIEAKAAKIKYVLVYVALLGALLLKSPGFAGYEPFATLFGLQGFGIQWFILPVVIFTSLFISRFWCRFFCPGMVINEVILKLRKIVGIIKGKMTRPSENSGTVGADQITPRNEVL
ncbi:MAG: 4Fe-4S binding protein [Dehalobacter sp. 4CP]|uniref:4Fe-4S binding protein n=1 Tax=Dehalobacter sp. CP TaxID=2594474 RepID=UPI0013CC06F9|nr:4Fe-4S binding protein [Dehalobacter sp. 4CP]